MDKQEVYNRLKEEIQSVEWDAIEPHFQRESVFICTPEQDLASVGCLIALDEVDRVKDMMAKGQLKKLAEEDAKSFSANKKFLFVIVQPFVFVQELH